MATLHVLQGPDKGRTYQTTDGPQIVGRSSGQISLSDGAASRRHAEIRPVNGTWMLEDLDSSNGTFLNGKRVVGPTELRHGDQIKVGATVLLFSGQEQVEAFSGADAIRDLVDLDLSNAAGGSSILTAVDASQESAVLRVPETADAVVAWNVVYKIAELIGTVRSVELFLERVTDIVFSHLVVDRLVLLMYKSDTGELTPQLVRYRKREPGRRPRIVTSQKIIDHVLRTRGGLLCANAMTDDRFSSKGEHDSIHGLGLRSIICVPIIVRDQVHGVFHLDCSMTHHTYTPEQLRLAVAIGRLVGMAIEDMRLVDSRVQTERLAAVGETVAYLSHHIRNILQGMQGGAEVVELGIKKGNLQATEQGWALVRRNLDRIFILTMNMLTFSKDRQPRIELTQLNRVVEDAIALVRSRVDEQSISILTNLSEIPEVPLDPEGMHQVAHNILLNAIEAVPDEGGRLRVSTRYDVNQKEVVLSIGDNGPGIRAEELGRIFDVFHSSKGHGGTGLGLAAAKKIVGELNGKIDVDSVIGQGTTFHVRIPTTQPEGGQTSDPGDAGGA